jgi:hypothetical protein
MNVGGYHLIPVVLRTGMPPNPLQRPAEPPEPVRTRAQNLAPHRDSILGPSSS